MRFEIESKSWFHFLLCQHNASGAIMQVVNMSSGAIHLKSNTYISYHIIYIIYMTVRYIYKQQKHIVFPYFYFSKVFKLPDVLIYFKFRA